MTEVNSTRFMEAFRLASQDGVITKNEAATLSADVQNESDEQVLSAVTADTHEHKIVGLNTGSSTESFTLDIGVDSPDDVPHETPAVPTGEADTPETPASPTGEPETPETPAVPTGEADTPEIPAPPGEVVTPETPASPTGESETPETPAEPPAPRVSVPELLNIPGTNKYDYKQGFATSTFGPSVAQAKQNLAGIDGADFKLVQKGGPSTAYFDYSKSSVGPKLEELQQHLNIKVDKALGSQTVNALLSKYADAVNTGNVEELQYLNAKIEELKLTQLFQGTPVGEQLSSLMAEGAAVITPPEPEGPPEPTEAELAAFQARADEYVAQATDLLKPDQDGASGVDSAAFKAKRQEVADSDLPADIKADTLSKMSDIAAKRLSNNVKNDSDGKLKGDNLFSSIDENSSPEARAVKEAFQALYSGEPDSEGVMRWTRKDPPDLDALRTIQGNENYDTLLNDDMRSVIDGIISKADAAETEVEVGEGYATRVLNESDGLAARTLNSMVGTTVEKDGQTLDQTNVAGVAFLEAAKRDKDKASDVLEEMPDINKRASMLEASVANADDEGLIALARTIADMGGIGSNWKDMARTLDAMDPAAAAKILNFMDSGDASNILEEMNAKEAALILASPDMDKDKAGEILTEITRDKVAAAILEEMSPADAAQLIVKMKDGEDEAVIDEVASDRPDKWRPILQELEKITDPFQMQKYWDEADFD